MKFRMSKPLVDEMDFVPKREITFNINIENIVDMSHLVDEDRMYELVGEAVKNEFINFMKNDMKRQLKLEEENTPQNVIEELGEMDKKLFKKNSMPNPIIEKDNKPNIEDFGIFRAANIAWNLRWDVEGYSKDVEMGHGFGESPYQYRQIIMIQINKLNAQITKATMNTANMIFAHYKMMNFFESLSTFQGSGTGKYKLGGKYDVFFTDKLPEEPIIYIASDKRFNLKSMPEMGKENGMSIVSFKTLNHFSDDEIVEYKKKLLGSIKVDNFRFDG
jgi:hypothetical protein